MNKIGTLAEKSLHAGIKEWYGRSTDQFEVKVDGFVIDIVRGEQLIEIQTRHFGAMKRKLGLLLDNHPVLLLHPIAQEKWIVRETAVGYPISRRKSPKKGQPLDLFSELMRIPHLLPHPNLVVGAVLTQQEEIWRDDGQGSWRRKGWSLHDHRLLDVVEMHTFATPTDLLALLPPDLPQPFTNKQLAKLAKIRTKLAQRITYTLARCDVIEQVGKDGRSNLYSVKENAF
ncbi:hypothetical protein [Candidatus Leptofilum sp.]|uniref:hypothetical protein n=1 Tax=Candidatus Leptofilum sp. TaxID=3241576 RepID=UPI003B5A3FD1